MDVYEAQENAVMNGKAAGGGKAKPLGNANGAKNGKTIEEMYQKKSQLEHILLRPDTYIGSIEKQQAQLWVHNGERLENRNVSYCPGLYKIFDEILVNAADNKVRDATMDLVRVDIDQANNVIRVFNNGDGIPVEVHKEEGIYVPELIFGHLLTSSNYDDQEQKVTGGRNGYGAKLANIFSREFIIETCDGSREKRYRQAFRDNMGVKEAPRITACKASDNWTCVTFKPDLVRFGMDRLDDDIVALMRKRVYDLAGILGKSVKVFLNGEKLPIKTFQDYVDMYLGPKENGVPRVYERVNDRWEVVVSVSDGQFNQVSFCNSICTTKGGTHVGHVADKVADALLEHIKKKHKNNTLKPFQVKNHLWIFVNALIVNPAFDSQTKETLTLKVSAFGSKCDLSDGFLKKVVNCGVVDNILSWAAFKQSKDLKKNDGAKRQRLLGIPKLDDANDAGGRSSEHCTLILTEGDSAKALAISGLSVVGRDRYGVFPLRGKLLNVRDATHQQIMANVEINHLKQILGLQHGKVYEDTKSLRYGHLMIMTDQDHDGSHIKGLIMNFLHAHFPSLMRIPGFLLEFITPIVKVIKGKHSHVFYTIPEYEAWKESLGGNVRGWTIKYYKGLGTSTSKEAKEYFSNLHEHVKEFTWSSEEDGEAIDMAFSKKKIEERKRWLANFIPGTFLDHAASHISYSDFVHRELILFSRADLDRSIPCMVDGLKPGQRKILYACFKRNLRADIKVAQLAGYVAEHSAYHHGEASLAATIINLAQDYVGANNINYLVPSGQFGTRLQGGKDAASPRYIFTRLAGITRHLFNEGDDKLLAYMSEEGQSIEPSWYMPILPTVLVNGAEGIGTGWSTSIPNYNPHDIVDNIRRLMRDEDQLPMDPYYAGFKGVIERLEKARSKREGASYRIEGRITQLDDTTLEITELPVGKWTQDYKEFLEALVKPENKDDKPALLDYKEHHTDTTVHFALTLSPEQMREALEVGLVKKFKLATTVSTSNMMLFDAEGQIKKYDSPEDIVLEFYKLRLDYYEKRRCSLLETAEAEMRRLSNKVRFIMAVIENKLNLSNRKKADIELDLQRMGFDRLPPKSIKNAKRVEGEEEAENELDASNVSYEYLLSMPLSSLTMEKVDALKEENRKQQSEVDRLHATTAKDMWSEDLDAFLEALRLKEEDAAREQDDLKRAQNVARKNQKAGGGARKAAPKKAKRAMDSENDDDDDESEEQDDSDFEVKPKKKAPAPKAAAASKPAPAWRPPVAAATATGAAALAAPKALPKAAGALAAPAPRPMPAAAPPPPKKKAVDSDDEDEYRPSLLERLAGRMGDMKVESRGVSTAAASTEITAARPGRAAAKAAASKLASVAMEEADEDEEGVDVTSPLPAMPKGAGNKAAGVAAVKRKPAAKPKKKKIDSEDDEDSFSEEEDESDDDFNPDTPLSAKPKAKVRRMRTSPFHKASDEANKGKAPVAKAPAVKKPAVAAKPKKVVVSEDEEDEVVVVVDAAPARAPRAARAAAQKKKYVEESEDEEEDSESEYNEESDYCASD